MLRTTFISQKELTAYIKEQTIRKEKGYLTCSERNTLAKLIANPTSYIHEIKEVTKGKPIITSLSELRKPCDMVTKDDNVTEIINDLKNSLDIAKGYGLSANQIGIKKRISVCYIPIYNKQTKQIDNKELILINPKIIEKERRIINKQEGCLSIPHIRVDTDRYVFITVEYLNEKLQPQLLPTQDLEALIIQHEVAHLNGRTILDDKHKRR